MSDINTANETPEFPRDRLSNVSSTTSSPADTTPKKATLREVIATMPLRVKMAAIWLLLVVFGAIYAKIDTGLLGGSLPLQNPNFQTNGFDPATSTFGSGEPIAGV